MNDNITPWQFIWHSKPFTIGMRPLDVADWFIIDRNLVSYLEEKAEMLASSQDLVFAEDRESRAAQTEIAQAVRVWLQGHCPEIYQFSGNSVRVADFGSVSFADDPPLLGVARLVQEDLLLLERKQTGWHLTSGALFFPSSWSLTEKMGQRLDAIHGPVPGFGPGTNDAGIMERIFDKLPVGKLALRWNWGLHGNGGLAQPPHVGIKPRFSDPSDPARVFLRFERQTLAKFPNTGAILFTVRLKVQSCAQLAQSEWGRADARALKEQLVGLHDRQLSYKGLLGDRDKLVEMLNHVIENRKL